MRMFWWNEGLHLQPDNQEEHTVLVALHDVLKKAGSITYGRHPDEMPPRMRDEYEQESMDIGKVHKQLFSIPGVEAVRQVKPFLLKVYALKEHNIIPEKIGEYEIEVKVVDEHNGYETQE